MRMPRASPVRRGKAKEGWQCTGQAKLLLKESKAVNPSAAAPKLNMKLETCIHESQLKVHMY